MDDLAACLRTWRDRTDPTAVGLPAGGGRRAPGLRREELAMLAGLSVDYLTRLEQGRAQRPSVSVLEPLARALRLTDEEVSHLYRLAGHGGPSADRVPRHIGPGVQRMLDRLGDVPVMVLDAAWYLLESNHLANALFGTLDGDDRHDRNVLWRHFTGASSRVRHTPEQDEDFRATSVSDLHAASARYPNDPSLHRLVADLRATSPDFARRWDRRQVAAHRASRKVVEHPEVGDVEVDCDVLTVQCSDLRMVVYTASPGSEAASKLALLGAIGQQVF